MFIWYTLTNADPGRILGRKGKTMTMFERHLLDTDIWGAVHSYLPREKTVDEIGLEVVRAAKARGYEAETVRCDDPDSRVVRVGDLKYKIFINRGWGFYDVVKV